MRLSSALMDLRAWLTLRDERSQFAVSQLSHLRPQLPLLYALLIINMTAVSYTHHGLAPSMLTVVLPCVLSAICAGRAIYWARCATHGLSMGEARAHLLRIMVLAAVLSASFVAWALALDQFGGPFEKGHVAFFIAITVIGCIFCLMHLPQAALLATGFVLVPYMVYYASVGHPVFAAVACNLSLVALVMVRVLLGNYGAFIELERSKAALASEQAQSRILGSQNALLANTDSLTGLPNRRAFFGRLDAMIVEGSGSGPAFVLGILDLDGFKPINDSLGHTVGDRVLVEISRRLEAAVGPGGIAARLGGDEFGILLVDGTTPEAAEAAGRAICDALGAPLTVEGMPIGCGASCGMVIHGPGRSRSAAALYDQADYALYDAKADRRGGAVLFAEPHETRLRAERAIEAALIAADLVAEMDVHFQPIVDLATGRDAGAEALARWNSPVLGRVPPDRFIEVAERTGLIRTLTPILLRKALASAAAWPASLDLSFNLSAHDVMSAETVLALVAAVRESGVDAGRITFEITETAVMRDFDLASRHIHLLRASGLKIALDDFGAGYSSLSCVHRLPLDKIKIDRSFVQDITHQAGARKVVQTILDLCGTLGLDCIVEGVETADQAALIGQLGARFAQGYHFARPLPEAQFMRRIREPAGRLAA